MYRIMAFNILVINHITTIRGGNHLLRYMAIPCEPALDTHRHRVSEAGFVCLYIKLTTKNILITNSYY